jgi:hypothetical protein
MSKVKPYELYEFMKFELVRVTKVVCNECKIF